MECFLIWSKRSASLVRLSETAQFVGWRERERERNVERERERRRRRRRKKSFCVLDKFTSFFALYAPPNNTLLPG